MKRGPQAKTSATSVIAAQRRTEILRMRLEGLTLEAIGDRMGIRPDTVHGIISRALCAMVKEPAEELLALELARCDALLAEAMQVVRAFHPATNGGAAVRIAVEDGNGNLVRDPQTGEMLTRLLEDPAPKLAAINTALRVMERRAKLLGLDRPVKIAATDPTGQRSEPVVQFFLPSNGRGDVQT